MLDAKEVLYRALSHKPGSGVKLCFIHPAERDRFRWRCYAAMSAEVRASKRELEPSDPEWGTHPWQEISVLRQGKLDLWIGRALDNEVQIVEGVPREAED